MGKVISKRQEECLRLSATMTDKEIARELDISPHTVSLHIRNAMKTLGAPNRRVALRSLAGNPYSGSMGIVSAADVGTVGVVHGQHPADDEACISIDQSSQFSWLALPVLLPSPPAGLQNRIGLIGLAAITILLIATSAMVLMTFVVESVGKLAVAS